MSHGDNLTFKGAGVRVQSAEPAGEVPEPSQSSVSREHLKEQLEERKAIPRNIALDSTLSVVLGEQGKGSYCQYGGPSGLRVDRVSRKIYIDPCHLLDEGNKFVIAHEGMHAYVTRSAFDDAVLTALSRHCDPEALYREVGFASLLNFLEDCGGNDWLTTNYPAFEADEQKLYDGMLRAENPEMHTQETQAVTAMLGFYPRFAQFGSEVMKRWHTGAYSATLDPSVKEVLTKQQQNADDFIKAFPDARMASADNRDILFCKRFLIAANKIMPDIRALIDQDKAQAALQQFVNQQTQRGQSQQQQQQGSEQQQGSQQQQGHQQQQGGQPQQGGQQQPGGKSSPNQGGGAAAPGAQPGLSPETRAEIDQKTAAHRDKLQEQLNKQLDDLEKHLGLQGTEPKSSEGAQSKNTAQRLKDLEKAINDRFGDPEDKDAKAEIERHLDSLKKLHESIDSQASPVDQLSPQAQEELKRLFDTLSGAERKALEQKAEELLKAFEDAIREGLEGKTQEKPAPTHRQQKQAKEDAERAAKINKQIADDIKRAEEERQSKLSLWDKAREDVAPLITALYSKLEQVLRPAVPEWESGHPTGNRINPSNALQAKADPNQRGKIWEQRTLPIERSFVFSLLVDNSGSMSMGGSEKYLHARRCAVLFSQVLTRLNVPFEISIFANNSEVLKGFNKKTTKQEKNEIAGAINGEGGGTEDFSAVEKCVAALRSRDEEHKFLIVVTDGGSNDPSKLVEVLQEALKSSIRVVGLGVGDGTEDVDKYYPLGRGGLTLDPNNKQEALGPYFAKLLEDILKNPELAVRKALKAKEASSKPKDEV